MKSFFKIFCVIFFLILVLNLCFSGQPPYLYSQIVREFNLTEQNSVSASGMELRLVDSTDPAKKYFAFYTDPFGKYSLYELIGDKQYGHYTIQIIINQNAVSIIDLLIDDVFVQLDLIINDSNQVCEAYYSSGDNKLKLKINYMNDVSIVDMEGIIDNYQDIITIKNIY